MASAQPIAVSMCQLIYVPNAESLTFLWAQLAPDLAALAGTCSYFIANANNFSGNHADIAGGVLYSSNITTTQLACNPNGSMQTPGTDCMQWSTTSFPGNTVGAEGVVGYGPGLAFPPAEMIFGGSSSNHRQISYISDGSSRVPMPLVNVLDQAGNTVKMLGLTANVSVTNVSSLLNGGSLPQLPGQTEAAGDANGDISIADLVLIATPGVYDLLVALPDFPEVSITEASSVATAQHSTAQYCTAQHSTAQHAKGQKTALL